MKCFILRGINTSFGFSTDDILNELIRAGLPSNTQVIEHITGFNRANPIIPHLYRVLVPFNFDVAIFLRIQAIFGVAVKFAKFVSRSTTQCCNCQSYFHTAAACKRPYRCVKCIDNHLPGECPKNNNNEAAPQCVNCHGYHTANNQPKCDYFIKTIQPIVNKRSNTTSNGKSTNQVHNIKPSSCNNNKPGNSPHNDKSYANIVINGRSSSSNEDLLVKIINALTKLESKVCNIHQHVFGNES